MRCWNRVWIFHNSTHIRAKSFKLEAPGKQGPSQPEIVASPAIGGGKGRNEGRRIPVAVRAEA